MIPVILIVLPAKVQLPIALNVSEDGTLPSRVPSHAYDVQLAVFHVTIAIFVSSAKTVCTKRLMELVQPAFSHVPSVRIPQFVMYVQQATFFLGPLALHVSTTVPLATAVLTVQAAWQGITFRQAMHVNYVQRPIHIASIAILLNAKAAS